MIIHVSFFFSKGRSSCILDIVSHNFLQWHSCGCSSARGHLRSTCAEIEFQRAFLKELITFNANKRAQGFVREDLHRL